MPLTPYELDGHDEERLAFRFSMLNDDQVVLCQISDAALDELLERRARKLSLAWRSFFRCEKQSNKPPRGSSTKSRSSWICCQNILRDLAGKPKEANQSYEVASDSPIAIVVEFETRYATRRRRCPLELYWSPSLVTATSEMP